MDKSNDERVEESKMAENDLWMEGGEAFKFKRLKCLVFVQAFTIYSVNSLSPS
jgi:hypothetical protein